MNAYGILNYHRPLDQRLLKAIPDMRHTIVCTDDPCRVESLSMRPKHILKAYDNVAMSKNIIIGRALSMGADYLYLLEDDIKILRGDIWQSYMELHRLLKYDVVMAGFIGNRNKVLGGRHNPSLNIKVNDHHFLVNRNIGNGFTLLKLSKNMVLYDENLTNLEVEYMIDDMYKAGKLPSNGFLPDIVDSHTYVTRLPIPRERLKNPSQNLLDIKAKGHVIEFDNNVDKFLNHVMECVQ